MKYKILLLIFISSVSSLKAQKTMVGLKISFGGTLTSVNDKDLTPSGANQITGISTSQGDGETRLVKSGGSVGLAFTLDLPYNERVYLATGLNFYSKAFTLSNRDGSYYGESSYGVTYLQIPIALKIYLKDFGDQLRFYGKLGPTIDFRIKEKLKGGDGAHFWNLAQNNYAADPTRGRNGDNKPMALFHPINAGILLSLGAEYKVADNIVVNAAINYNPSFVNMINPALKINNPPKTRVGELLKIRTSIVVVEVGAALLF